MKTPAQHIQHLINLYKLEPSDLQEEITQAQLSLNQLVLERRTNLTGFREALLSLELAHTENLRNGYTPAIIGWLRERIKALEGKA
jgi:hypothetical protein